MLCICFSIIKLIWIWSEIILGLSKEKDFSKDNGVNSNWNLSQDVGLEYFRGGEIAKIRQWVGESQGGKHSKFYLVKYSFEVRAL